MSTKTIAIMDDVYQLLEKMKAPHESFTELLRRLAKKKGDIMEFAGSWSDCSEKEAEELKKKILLMRSNKRLRELEHP